MEFERLEIPVGELVFDARAAGPADGELVLLLHGFPET
ncbi:MAG: alpha/beta hydrolase, partial [Acidimicrobiia bacterium]|nr:alpha/beta hydrolase [Acidimicrobiia bacterium]